MKVKDIIIRACRFLGRDDIAAALQSGGDLTGETSDAAETLLYCVNAVEDELARYYFPLKTSENIYGVAGRFSFKRFSKRPVKILSVKSGGREISYKQYPEYLECDFQDITVEYCYAPEKKTMSDDSEFDGANVCEKLVAAGTAAEYSLLNGSVQNAELWESMYRQEIDLAQRKVALPLRVPPRRWV